MPNRIVTHNHSLTHACSKKIRPTTLNSTVLANSTSRQATSLAENLARNPELQFLASAFDLVQQQRNLCPVLPLLFRWESKPIDLTAHFPFEILFDMQIPRIFVKKCGRQVGKSLSTAMWLLIMGLWRANFNQFYITPFFEMTRKFSTNYLSTLIDDSPARGLFRGPGSVSQVLQRTLPNRSSIYLSYAYRDAGRTRGANTKMNHYDEVQMMFLDVIDIIRYTMSGSPLGNYETWSGTPLSRAGTLDHIWRETTQSEWLIPCYNCKAENVAATHEHLTQMIDYTNRDINPTAPGLICHKCRFPIFTYDGHWLHTRPDRRESAVGIHLPQPIMPYHCNSTRRWSDLVAYLKNPANSQQSIYNELFGESYDGGAKLITYDDILRAAVLNDNNLEAAKVAREKYQHVILGVDFGGGALRVEAGQDRSRARPLSRTKIAAMGLTADGRLEIFLGLDSPRPWDRVAEIKLILYLIAQLRIYRVAYDLANGGWIADQFMREIGIPSDLMIPFTYTGVLRQGMIQFHPAGPEGQMSHYSLDKSRSLMMMAEAIKLGLVQFFNVRDRPRTEELLLDFANLELEESDRQFGVPVPVVQRAVGTSDDFAHAVNFGANYLWAAHGYPNLAANFVMNETIQSRAHGKGAQDAMAGTWSQAEIDLMMA